MKNYKSFLHAIIGFAVGLGMYWALQRTFEGVPVVIQWLISEFICVLAFAFWEWLQGAIFGAGKTKAQAKDARTDVIIGGVASAIGIIVSILIF